MIARLAATLLAGALLALPAPAAADFSLQGLAVSFEDAEGGAERQAGAHPFAWVTELGFETKEGGLPYEVPDGSPRRLVIEAPPGVVLAPTATERCTTLEFLQKPPACPIGSQIGITDVNFNHPEEFDRAAVYNLVPPPGVVAKLGFTVIDSVPVTVEGAIKPTPPYNAIATLTNIPQAVPFYGATTTLWGNPSDPVHNPEREGCVGECAAGLAKTALLTVPRSCEGTLSTSFAARPWEDFGALSAGVAPTPSMEGCERVGFAPDLQAQATSRAASAPTGMQIELEIEDEGISNPSTDAVADSEIKRAVVTLPEGMTANPSLAEGLETCSPSDFEGETLAGEPGEGCPEASKIGSLEAATPLLEGETLRGDLFIAQQGNNPFDSLLALYMVIRDRPLGVLAKIAGRVEPDSETGRLRTIFGEPGHELPQLPVSRFSVRLREGGRSPLVSPPSCGTHEVEARLTPWADPSEPLEKTARFEIDAGVGGAPCPPAGAPPFEPGFSAGTLSNAAASYSPFLMRLTRRDGDQDLTRFDAILPRGVVAKLAGVARCPDWAIAQAKEKTGKEERAAPSCPAASRIGPVLAGAGVGAQLTYVPGSVYLAGPVGAAPLSVVAIVPAVAGPFDVGTVVVRQALVLDPVTAEVKVDSSLSDPIPHILQGIPLAVRDVQVSVDRPAFTLNPTSCDPQRTLAGIWGGGQAQLSAHDDAPVLRAAHFQAADCGSLGFQPRLGLRLFGGTSRGGHPALRAVYRPRPGHANLRRMALALPRSEFIDNANFRTICTRVQFAADACPQGAIYGRVVAHSPLLEEPLHGPAYLRSSDNFLPDLVFDLRGIVDVEVAIRIDSVKGRLRATVEGAPDVPVSKVVVRMQGGHKGLFVNSRDICASKNRARVRAVAHNSRRAGLAPPLRPRGCKKQRRGR